MTKGKTTKILAYIEEALTAGELDSVESGLLGLRSYFENHPLGINSPANPEYVSYARLQEQYTTLRKK